MTIAIIATYNPEDNILRLYTSTRFDTVYASVHYQLAGCGRTL